MVYRVHVNETRVILSSNNALRVHFFELLISNNLSRVSFLNF